ncbi:MAG: helix-turn-helix protein [Solirubrobacterales bacterium]|nr:helix-turn-helix protein [Solirubrobacterales bacterium]
MASAAGREPTIERRTWTRKDGTVGESIDVRYVDASGKRRRRRCASIDEAQYERAGLVLGRGGRTATPDLGALTVSEFWPQWRTDAGQRLADATLADYDGSWKRRIQPRFGHVAMRDVTPRAISTWRTELHAAGIGPEAVRKAMVLLQSMFTIAIEWGEAEANPVSVVRKPRQGRRRAVSAMTPHDVEHIRRWLDDGDLFSATLVSVLAYTGLRPGEAIALEARHVRENTILAEQAVADGKLKLQKTGRLYRTVDLLSALADDLALWQRERRSEGPGVALFTRPDRELLRRTDWNNWRNRRFYAATKACGLGAPRPYDLRHSFASLLIREQKTSIVDLAEQLGHSPTETLKTYAHVFAEHRRAEPVAADEWIALARRDVHRDGTR